MAHATKRIGQATEQITLMSMVLTNDPGTDELIDALAEAARRGVHVSVAADVFTFGEIGGHFIPQRYYTERSRHTTKMAKELESAGVEFQWLGRFSSLPFIGRTHSKCLLVDNHVYSFGGVNLHDKNLGYKDYMFYCEDAQLASQMRDELVRIIKSDGKPFSYRSNTFSFGEKSTVLFDSGLQGRSIIYRRACKLAAQSKKVVFVSQYSPTGKLGKIMRATKSTAYYNTPENASSWNSLIIRFGSWINQQNNSYQQDTYIHAKFMIFTLQDGSKVAMTGSHNFIPGTVLMGTREIALETTDKHVIKQLEKFIKTELR